MPRPHAIAIPARSASCRVNGPYTPAGRDGARSHGTSIANPMSRRRKAQTPIAKRTRSTPARATTDGQSLTPAIGRCPAVHVKNESGFSESIKGESVA